MSGPVDWCAGPGAALNELHHEGGELVVLMAAKRKVLYLVLAVLTMLALLGMPNVPAALADCIPIISTTCTG